MPKTYREYRDRTIENRPGVSFILNEFAALRRNERSHPLMTEVELMLTAETSQKEDCPTVSTTESSASPSDDSEEVSDSFDHLRKMALSIKRDQLQQEADDSRTYAVNTAGGTYRVSGPAEPVLRRPAG
jgi:hypothetical protein